MNNNYTNKLIYNYCLNITKKVAINTIGTVWSVETSSGAVAYEPVPSLHAPPTMQARMRGTNVTRHLLAMLD